LNTLVNFESALLGLDGQFSVGVNSLRAPCLLLGFVLSRGRTPVGRAEGVADERKLDMAVSHLTQLDMKTIYTTEVFDGWFDSLRDKQAARRIQARIDRAEEGNFGDHKSVGAGVSEMRIHHGPGFRVYFTQRGLGSLFS
jgi:putative addiction module killer protein